MAKKKPKAQVAEDTETNDVSSALESEPESSEIPKGQLGDWKEKIPPAVQKAVDAYVAALRDKNAAVATMNSAKDNCLMIMEEHGIDSVPIDEGGKRLCREQNYTLKTKKANEDELEG